ncbi:Ribosomal protein S6 modification protein [Planctomycetes bacterium CA13]|uniref:Ribosomal protein S6 modification protein n=1 Tax=Novipirellula herctigrandis TaxID=2527986 RepID=A0A5C5YZC6_9BACT|nr:Ribosomal protein S6 modification protein [Planctomycetes bacterium CA13]
MIPRIGASVTDFGTAVVRQLEPMNVFVANRSAGIANSRDKFRSLQILSRHSIGMPKTTFVRDRGDVTASINRIGGAPVIIKLLEGTQGVGVILADSIKIAEAIIETLQTAKQNVLVQGFVGESKGRDARAFVVGDRVVGAMRRVAQGDEFRSNVHRGGQVESIELDDEYRETAIRAAQIMGLRIAGVDMLEGKEGPQVMEVNSFPGLEGIERATRTDIAGAIVDYCAAHVDFPEMDIRQRLTVNRGYGVCELVVPEGSHFVGMTIAEAAFTDKDINVLTLYRGSTVIPNPKSTRNMEAGDRLLCSGKQEAMKAMVPTKTRKKRSPKIKTLDSAMIEDATSHSDQS